MDWSREITTWEAVSFAALLAFVVCATGNRIAASFGLFDEPDGIRKRHGSAVPLVGGLAILLPLVACISIALALGVNSDRHLQLVLVLCSLGAGMLGFADDQTELQAPTRILLLVIFAAIALVVDPRLFPSALHLTPSIAIPIGPAIFSTLFVVAAVGIVNAVNMADGRDGLVGSMYVVWSLCLLIAGVRPTHYAAVAIAGSSLVFLAFNLRGKLFLGDCGTYGVTFAIGIVAAAAHANGRIPLETITVWFALPVLDCLRVMASRIRHKRSPFSPDRQHLHHILEERFGRTPALVIYVGAIATTSLIATLEPSWSAACLIGLVLGFATVTWRREAGPAIEHPFHLEISDEMPSLAPAAAGAQSLISDRIRQRPEPIAAAFADGIAMARTGPAE